MFRRRSDAADPATAPPAEETAARAGQEPKGRPTPSRREAEAARKQALKVPKDPKAAKKAMRERDRQARMEARAGLVAGDEKRLPPRDQGPVKAYVRDFIDGRFTAAEYFVFIALGVLVLGFVQNPVLYSWVSLGWFVVTGIIVVDTGFLLWRLNRALKQRWPDKAERKGALFYGGMRTLQLRRLRLPPPRVKRGGAPVEPKKSRR
jgi:Protein of unknown function (DUF3043)